MRNGLSLLIALCIAASSCAGSTAEPAVAARGADSLPPVPLVTLDGTATDLAAVLRGRVAMISLWATWCDACQGEIDALERLQRQAGARVDAVVLGVAVGETREHVAAFARQRGMAHPQLVDENFRLADALGEPRVPATLVVDRGGHILFRGGALDSSSLAAFRSALAVH